MALRLVEIMLPTDRAEALRETLGAETAARAWTETVSDGRVLVRLVLDAEHTRPVIDAITERFASADDVRLLILPVEAVLPLVEDEPMSAPVATAGGGDAGGAGAPGAPGAPGVPGGAGPGATFGGLSREELHNDIADLSHPSRVFAATVVLSTVVAAVGILRDNVAIIIGAMVIAPLLGPNVALAFATTVGDGPLAARSVRSNVFGVAIALGLTILLGLVVPFDPAGREIAERTEVGYADVALALAAGSAGALAVTAGVSSALVGVMVAVALLPPTIVLGLLVGRGLWSPALGALLLLATNVICLNLAAVVTFLARGVRPTSWWQADRARRLSRAALAVWLVLLVVLLALIGLAAGR